MVFKLMLLQGRGLQLEKARSTFLTSDACYGMFLLALDIFPQTLKMQFDILMY